MKSRKWFLVPITALAAIAAVMLTHRDATHFPQSGPPLVLAATPTQAPPASRYPGTFVFRQTTSVCTTSGVVGNTCANPTVTLPTAFTDPSTYSVVATCVGGVTGVPVVASVTKAAASPKIQVNVMGVTAASASCTEIDVMVASLTIATQ